MGHSDSRLELRWPVQVLGHDDTVVREVGRFRNPREAFDFLQRVPGLVQIVGVRGNDSPISARFRYTPTGVEARIGRQCHIRTLRATTAALQRALEK